MVVAEGKLSRMVTYSGSAILTGNARDHGASWCQRPFTSALGKPTMALMENTVALTVCAGWCNVVRDHAVQCRIVRTGLHIHCDALVIVCASRGMLVRKNVK